jgi:hypothetical protein
MVGGAIEVRMAKSKKNNTKLKLNVTVREERRNKLEQMATIEKRSISKSDEYEKLPAADREHFMQCPHCGETLSLEDVFLHVARKQRPNIRYSGNEN